MKPLGPIPSGFNAIDGELAIAGYKATALVERAGGTPLFVYSRELLTQRVAALRAAMPAWSMASTLLQAVNWPSCRPSALILRASALQVRASATANLKLQSWQEQR